MDTDNIRIQCIKQVSKQAIEDIKKVLSGEYQPMCALSDIHFICNSAINQQKNILEGKPYAMDDVPHSKHLSE